VPLQYLNQSSTSLVSSQCTAAVCLSLPNAQLTLFSTHRTLHTVLFTVQYKPRNFKTVTFRASVLDMRSLAAKRTTQTLHNSQQRRVYRTIHTYYASNSVTSRTCFSQLGKLLRQLTHTTPWNTQLMCTETFSHVHTLTHTQTQRVPT